jgi:hypothetical protein
MSATAGGSTEQLTVATIEGQSISTPGHRAKHPHCLEQPGSVIVVVWPETVMTTELSLEHVKQDTASQPAASLAVVMISIWW